MIAKDKTKKVYLETFGCQMNVSDSERIADNLVTNGYEMTLDSDSADVVLLNTCSVREKAEHKLFSRVGHFNNLKNKPKIGVMGCVAQLEGETIFNRANGVDFVVGTRAISRISDVISKNIYDENLAIDLGEREFDYDWSVNSKQRFSPHIAFVPIIEGCNKFCTYCIVPFSRGRERSLSAQIIVEQVKNLINEGVKEIHLIGQNVNSYRPLSDVGLEGFAGATKFSKLLRAVAATGMERIKFATSFPRDFHPDIVTAINENENLCNWVHLPVQSGSNKVLRDMRRGHTIEDYKKRVDIIRSSPRNISLTTDIIIGFPGETTEDFNQTLDLMHYCQYDSAYFFKYSVRKGTISSAMVDSVSETDKSTRFDELTIVHKLYQQKQLRANCDKVLKVLAERTSTKNTADLTGHSTCHKIVNFQGNQNDIGKVFDIKITSEKTNSLYGEIYDR
jgi:tRNA-2-methylthio-N6-dimethylallyladenosine synthase